MCALVFTCVCVWVCAWFVESTGQTAEFIKQGSHVCTYEISNRSEVRSTLQENALKISFQGKNTCFFRSKENAKNFISVQFCTINANLMLFYLVFLLHKGDCCSFTPSNIIFTDLQCCLRSTLRKSIKIWIIVIGDKINREFVWNTKSMFNWKRQCIDDQSPN